MLELYLAIGLIGLGVLANKNTKLLKLGLIHPTYGSHSKV